MNKIRLCFMVILAVSLLTACGPETTPTQNQVPFLSGTLRPYPSDTPSPSPFPSDYATATLPITPTVTATPILYTVKEDDDMFGISIRYGISLDALKTANPTVNPYYMGEGLVLVIPVTPTPTPIATQPIDQTGPPTKMTDSSLQTDCYREKSGGIYCFALVHNETEKPIENISALVTLTGTGNAYTESQVAILPLNILPAQQTMPLITYFQPPTPMQFSASAKIDFSLPVPEGDTRYLSATISELVTHIAGDNLSATISGEVIFSDPNKPASSAWVLAVAYSEDGSVAGIRRWDAQVPVKTDQPLNFTLHIYSLGPLIERTEVFVESRPVVED